MRAMLIWGGLTLALMGPLIGASQSPLLAWRDPIYIAAGFAGILGMALLLLQPLLGLGLLPGVSPQTSRKLHRTSGLLLLTSVLGHIAGLWITSPPDVVDALLLVSPTPFSIWGVIAMWALFATAALAFLWRKTGLRWITWTRVHRLLGLLIASTTILHVALIEGTMDIVSKWGLSALLLLAALAALAQRRIWRRP